LRQGDLLTLSTTLNGKSGCVAAGFFVRVIFFNAGRRVETAAGFQIHRAFIKQI
jgi:hypothetical protein